MSLPVPRVSVCIVAYNRRDALADTLRRMTRDLDYPADRLEVLVVDNASQDATADMVRRDFPEVELVVNPENIGAPAWNAAFARSSGDFCLILDDDCHLRPEALGIAVAAAQEAGADLVSMSVAAPGADDFRFEQEYPTGLLSFWGCAALLSRRAVERTGGYDPGIFIWANEAELTMRVLDAGLIHLFVPEAVAVHLKAPDSMRGFNEVGSRMNLRNFAYVALKHLRGAHAAGALGNLVLRALLEKLQRPRTSYLPAVLEGARAGLRAREPLRPEVSGLYRRHFIEFRTPLQFVRGPLTRWRGRHDPGAADAEIQRRREAFAAARPRLYPAGRAALRVPSRSRAALRG